MGSHFSAPVKVRSERATRGILALFLVIGVLAAITITGSGIAGAADLSFGGYSPYIANGGADVNFDGAITSADDSTGFMGTTKLKDGYLDCDGWDSTNDINDFDDLTPGDGSITTADDCVLQGFFVNDQEVFIHVIDGRFSFLSDSFAGSKTPLPDGWKMPWLYDTADVDLDDTDYETAQWAWVIEAGYVDYDHDGNTGDDSPQNYLPNNGDIEAGLVDVNDDGTGNSSDDCTKCFFGLDVNNGKVQDSTVSNPFLGGVGPAGPAGTPGTNGVSGRVSIASSSSTNSLNKSKSALCSGTTKVLGGGYSLTGDTATLAHLTVVANGPAGGTAWRVRVIEATPTAGTWAVTVTAICATA